MCTVTSELPSGKMTAGFRQTMRAVSQGKAVRVYIAQDAQDSLRSQVLSAAQAAQVPVVQAESMIALGHMCRIGVGCAAAAEIQ